MLGAGEGGVALPKAFPNDDLVAAQTKNPDCLRYAPLVNKPRAQWPPHLAAAPLHFLYLTGVSCVQVDCAIRREIDAKSGKTARKLRSRRPPPSLGRSRIVLPADFRQRAIHAHDLSYYGGHFGLAKTFARLAEVLVASAARRCSCVPSAMYLLYGQHPIFEAVALAQPPHRYALRDRCSGYLRPAQTHSPRPYPYTRAHRPSHSVDGPYRATRTHGRDSSRDYFRALDFALGNDAGAPDGQRAPVHGPTSATAHRYLWDRAHLQFALQPPRQLRSEIIHAHPEEYAQFVHAGVPGGLGRCPISRSLSISCHSSYCDRAHAVLPRDRSGGRSTAIEGVA